VIDVQFDTVLLSPATANAVKVVSTEHVVAHSSRDLSVLGIVGYGLNAPASEAAPSLLPRNSAPAHLYFSQVYRDRASIAR